ncbi:NAD-dependent epimerase/dehydratase family protein [Psychromicrobium xiongbiense]|uniref:NAD-dependent epimerase/dehydratase family protein n=1 Tax=Psychromicrobium xiongbiense TaxID=3051184 RepID=UPI002555BBFE|nr:NAD-dependent epimerase/dehydratase family protein [Psychromicrobium sp. YIM S02556]
MRLLVTGGAGFIGGHVVEAALAQGWQVRILDSLSPQVHTQKPSVPDGVELVQGSVTDPDAVAQALQGVDLVSHQAAKVGLGVSFADAPDYVEQNIHGTTVLLAGLAQHHIRGLVLASSMVVYGEGLYRTAAGRAVRPAARNEADLAAGIFDPRDPDTGELLHPGLLDEDAMVDPRNVYATSKLSQELLSSHWARECGGRVIALRYHNVYGARMPKNTPYAGVCSIFRSALERDAAPRVFEDGQQRRSFVEVRDVAAANLAALQSLAQDEPCQQRPSFRAYNVGSTEVRTVGEVAQALSAALGGPAPVITGEYRLGDVRHVTASSERIHRELGWTPHYGFVEGMRNFALAPLRD